MNISILRKVNKKMKLNITMKLKSNVIITFVVTFLFFAGITAQAQGIYNNKDDKQTNLIVKDNPIQAQEVINANDEKVNSEENIPSNGNSGGIFRDGPGGGTEPGGSDPELDPIGEGILFLSLLSGIYALIRRNIKIKNED